MPFYPFFGESSPTKMEYSKKGTLILASLLENLDKVNSSSRHRHFGEQLDL